MRKSEHRERERQYIAWRREWQPVNDFFTEQDNRRLEDIPDARPSGTIWAISNIWDNINGSAR